MELVNVRDKRHFYIICYENDNKNLRIIMVIQNHVAFPNLYLYIRHGWLPTQHPFLPLSFLREPSSTHVSTQP